MESHLGDRRSAAGRVMGLCGVFFTSPDPAALNAKYTRHLGLDPGDQPGAASLPDDMPAHADAKCEPRLRENAEQQQRLVVLLRAVSFDLTHD